MATERTSSFDRRWTQDHFTHVSKYPGPEALYDYELFTLVNPGGQIDNGHYELTLEFPVVPL